jgi:hypothetical protein
MIFLGKILNYLSKQATACYDFIFVLWASGFCLPCLPRIHFCLSGKHFPLSLLARVPFSLLRQAVSAFLACPESTSASQASIFCPFCLLEIHFSLSGKPLCLPVFRFRFSGEHFPLSLLARVPFSLLRQTVTVFFACPESTSAFQASIFSSFFACRP